MSIISTSLELCPKEYLNRNFAKELDLMIKDLDPNNPPSLLLHSCCAPCSSHCIAYMSNYFNVTVFFYNPNIEDDEYQRRAAEQKRFIDAFPSKNKVTYLEGDYEPELFETIANARSSSFEGGPACMACYKLRLQKAGQVALDNNFDCFATTLTLSPMKAAALINYCGDTIAQKLGVKYILTDFKKKNGYKNSIDLSKEYDLYRQDFCGCQPSRLESEERIKK